jgi:RNA polymerase sigma-70 factor (ECF subfamily)
MHVTDFPKDPPLPRNHPSAVPKTVDLRLAADPSSFFDELHPQVFRFIAATGAPAADVDDLVQETLLHAWRSRAQYRGEASVSTWVLAIARNRVRMRLRSLDEEEIPGDVLRDAETAGAVRRALEDLDPDQREALIRRYYDGLSVKELALRLDESEKAVESRLHRAREALREKLKQGDDHE